MPVFAFPISQLGLHVHAEVNQEGNRQTNGNHWRSLDELMHSQTTDVEGDATEELEYQRDTAEVNVEYGVSREAFHHIERRLDGSNNEHRPHDVVKFFVNAEVRFMTLRSRTK